MLLSEITSDRVRENTGDHINRAIDADTDINIRLYSAQHPRVIKKRIRDLDEEWDVERTLELNAATAAFTGVLLAATVSKRWLLLPGIVSFFLAQHAIQGWCPPLTVFRRLKIRTRKEIDKEKYALLDALREIEGSALD